MDEINEIIRISKDKSYQQQQNEILLQPFVHIGQIAGKKVRLTFAGALNHWLNIPEKKLHLIIDIVDMIHNSSLLFDDIEDDSILRRGLPVAHSIYGVPSTINAASYVSYLTLEKIALLNHSQATKVFTEQLLELHRGQGMEIYWRDNFTIPPESDYKVMALRKTGGVLMLSVRLMQLFSANEKDFSKLTAILGLYFQIRDDYSNLCMQEYTDNKSFCDNLTEGKFSFPVIHAVLDQATNKEVLNILSQRTHDVGVKKYCVSLLEKMGSFKYTRVLLESLDKQAREEVDRLGCNPIMKGLLNKLISWKTTTE